MGKPDGRIWRACQSCRRKKIKCDGQDPCHGCESRGQLCEFPDSNDNASASRRYATSLEERCQQMDELCTRLEGLAKNLSECILTAQREHQPPQYADPNANHPMPLQREEPIMLDANVDNDETIEVDGTEPSLPEIEHVSSSRRPSMLEAAGAASEVYDSPVDQVAHMVSDSYGRLRYIGGAANKIMIEAVQSLSPEVTTARPVSQVNHGEVGLPFFVKGQIWPELPSLPRPEDLARPPQYISDLLINIYFDQIHYTFPILYKPEFMRRYQELCAAKRDDPVDRGFLSVFFALCACASNLLPRSASSTPMPGIEFYQKALLLQFASVGEVFIEQVQCLGLLAVCSAGWNTLSQSWRFIGQAVRIAQDLGLHVSSSKGFASDDPNPSSYIELHVTRCIWWSVFGLDCLMSICLGRPMAANEADCCCDLPYDISNEDLDHFGCPPSRDHNLASSPMTGFIVFIRLCKIAARVHQLYSSRKRGKLGDSLLDDDLTSLLPSVNGLVRELDTWLNELPNEIRFSANMDQRGPNITMCVIVFIFHSGTIMNLYRPLTGHPVDLVLPNNPSVECLNAAQSCIQAAELLRERVPPTHYIAYCVQYLTISGILMLSMMDKNESSLLPDIKMALQFLGDVEDIWPAASRSRLIIDRLIENPPVSRERIATATAREGSNIYFPSLPALDGLMWDMENFLDPS